MCNLKNGLYILSAYQETCLKPCTDVEYSVSSSKHLTDLSLLPFLTGCPEGQTFAEISFRRKMEIETVRTSGLTFHFIVWGRCHLISLIKGKSSCKLNDVLERIDQWQQFNQSCPFLGKVCAGHYWRFHWVGRISRTVAWLVVTWHCRSDDFIVQNSGASSQIINTTYLV